MPVVQDGANFGEVGMRFRRAGSEELKLVRDILVPAPSVRPAAVCVSVPVRLGWVTPLVVPIFAA